MTDSLNGYGISIKQDIEALGVKYLLSSKLFNIVAKYYLVASGSPPEEAEALVEEEVPDQYVAEQRKDMR